MLAGWLHLTSSKCCQIREQKEAGSILLQVREDLGSTLSTSQCEEKMGVLLNYVCCGILITILVQIYSGTQHNLAVVNREEHGRGFGSQEKSCDRSMF